MQNPSCLNFLDDIGIVRAKTTNFFQCLMPYIKKKAGEQWVPRLDRSDKKSFAAVAKVNGGKAMVV
jgi:hypothetical protein